MKLAIIGAGASGLVASIEAAKRGIHVTVFEKNTKIGRKILATGNGRCNITNQNIAPTFYHSSKPSFVNASLSRFGSQQCVDYFRVLGLEVREGEKGRLYPMNHQSSTVVDMLVHTATHLGVVFLVENEVSTIEKKEGLFSLHVKQETLLFDACIIATGGLAMPTLGSCDSGYRFAKALGHTLVEACPSLVQLVCDDNSIYTLSGVKVEGCVGVYVDNELKRSALGDVLFTNYGISGSAVLDISRDASVAHTLGKNVRVAVDLMPQFSKEQLENLLQKRLTYAHNRSLVLWLEGIVNKKLASFILKHASLPETMTTASMLGSKEIKKIAYLLKHVNLTINGTKGFGSAEVTVGGINVAEIYPETFESKLHKNLYITGEVLDVDGDCGGYNLHFAWASGYMAGQTVLK